MGWRVKPVDIPQPQSRGKLGQPVPVWRFLLCGRMRNVLQNNTLGMVVCLTADVKAVYDKLNGFVIG